MGIPVQDMVPGCRFPVTGVSYAGAPRPNTAVYMTAKAADLMDALRDVDDCLVFLQTGMEVPAELKQRHCFVFSDKPQYSYTCFAERLAMARDEEERRLKYLLREPGYYVSETAVIGEDAWIEPGCVIGHHVVIGDHARIKAGTVIKHAVIGDWFLANENAVIGANGFTMADDSDGDLVRIPTLGLVRIGDHVEIGVGDNISCGSAGDTVIEDHVKVDALVHVAHDVHLHRNVEVAAGGIIGGYTEIGEGVFVGINSALKQLLTVDDAAYIGMGAAVIRPVGQGTTVVGNPARPIRKK